MHNRNEIPLTCIILASGSEKVTRFRQYDNDLTELMGNDLCIGVKVIIEFAEGSCELKGRFSRMFY
jgi:hypothetical protein